ncbi:MAG: HAD family phosphatase [Candidatus Aenigmarchaeota archaeon]|nr:HAD family phosphatase [Candidatus Aenigmarchaeota archaeon]
MLRAALLDIDGVLIDSEEQYYQLMREVFLHYGFELGREEYVRRWITEQKARTRGVIEDHQLAVTYEEAAARRKQLLDKYIERMAPMPHAREMVGYLTARCHTGVGVVTSADREEAGKKLRSMGMQDVFSVAVMAEDVQRYKPFPDCYIEGAHRLGTEPPSIVVVEDNPLGVRSAKDAGCKTIAYPNGFTAGMDFGMADRVVKSLAEIDGALLDGLFG